MRRVVSILFATLILTSCLALANPKTLEEVKTGLTCVKIKEGMKWPEIAATLGDPDVAPLPQPGDLSKNARVYQGVTLIVYTQRQQIKEGDRPSFAEVVYQVEVCKGK